MTSTIRISAVCVAALLTGCDFGSPDRILPLELVEETEAVRVQVTGTTVIRSASEWEAFWIGNGGPSPVPPVDFERQFVAGVFYGGTQRTGCENRVSLIESAFQFGREVEVRLKPLPDLGPCRAVVYPIDLVAFNAPVEGDYSVSFKGAVP